jgi:hypothetical protein
VTFPRFFHSSGAPAECDRDQGQREVAEGLQKFGRC